MTIIGIYGKQQGVWILVIKIKFFNGYPVKRERRLVKFLKAGIYCIISLQGLQ